MTTPTTPRQVARRRRILETAATLTYRGRLADIPMSDIAMASGVASGTLYRYFHSKTHLFATLFQDRVARFIDSDWSRTDPDPIVAVADNLIALNRSLSADRHLCSTMLCAIAASHMDSPPADLVWPDTEALLVGAILNTLAIDRRDTEAATVAQLVTNCWWGALTSVPNRGVAPHLAEAQLRSATSMLLAHLAHRGDPLR